MPQYGPPQRFKAVNVKTGESISTSKLVLDFDEQFHAVKGGDTIDFDAEWIFDYQVYQSTGHTINGQELFFGDVVLIDGEMREVQWDHSCSAAVTAKGKRTYPLDWMLPDHILGNIHAPKEVLKQKAEDLKDART